MPSRRPLILPAARQISRAFVAAERAVVAAVKIIAMIGFCLACSIYLFMAIYNIWYLRIANKAGYPIKLHMILIAIFLPLYFAYLVSMGLEE